MLAHGASLFSARISPDKRTRDEVFWMLELRYEAAGPCWRRVRHWERPALWLQVSSFKPQLKSWRDLERLNFWEFGHEEDCFFGPAGVLEADYLPNGPGGKIETTAVNDFIWRVAGREGGWFTVELAGVADGQDMFKQLLGREELVTPDGKVEKPEPDADFWKKNAELYLIENVPFGTVTVEVPRNARDPEAHALARARTLIGVDEPEHIEVRDFYKREKPSETLKDDIYVELHFNGYYES